jgi:sugar phosphate permease
MVSRDNMGYRWVVLLIFVVAQIFLSIAGFGWGPLAPFLKKLMSLSNIQLGAISSTFFFSAAFFAFPAGVIVDRSGVKRGVLLWLGLTGIPLLILSFFQHSYTFLLFMVAIAGLGYGMGNPVTSKGLLIEFDKRTRGTAMGIRQSAVTVGAAVAGVFLVYLSQRYGPFMALRMISLMIIAMSIPLFLFYHDTERNDFPPGSQRSARLSFKGLFTNRPLLIVSLSMAMLGFAQGVVTTFLLLYANERLGYSLLAAGSLLSIVMIGGTVGRIFWGVVSDRLFHGKRKPVLLLISMLAVLSVTALAFWDDAWPHWLFIPIVIAIGLSTIGWNAIAIVLVAEISPITETATAVGLASTIAWGGLFIGPIIFGGIADYFGYFHAWIFVAFICLVCLILYLFALIPDAKHEDHQN